MIWEVVLTDAAMRDLRRMDKKVAERVIRALERPAETGHGDVARLTADDLEWRLRVGDWRVRFVFDYETHTITVLHIRHRGSAYRD